jgi:hypothetical protein
MPSSADPQEVEEKQQGSWLPLVAVIVMLVIRWLVYGQGNIPVRFQRWYNMQVSQYVGILSAKRLQQKRCCS